MAAVMKRGAGETEASVGNAPISPRYAANSQYIDITSLLNLPQKEAARKLGISESMLCKRFKETTRRKWPYRYVRKLEKIIEALRQQNDSAMSEDSSHKLSELEEERKQCLKPVQIRVTHDLNAIESDVLDMTDKRQGVIAQNTDEDIPEHILETLGTMRHISVSSF